MNGQKLKIINFYGKGHPSKESKTDNEDSFSIATSFVCVHVTGHVILVAGSSKFLEPLIKPGVKFLMQQSLSWNFIHTEHFNNST